MSGSTVDIQLRMGEKDTTGCGSLLSGLELLQPVHNAWTRAGVGTAFVGAGLAAGADFSLGSTAAFTVPETRYLVGSSWPSLTTFVFFVSTCRVSGVAIVPGFADLWATTCTKVKWPVVGPKLEWS